MDFRKAFHHLKSAVSGALAGERGPDRFPLEQASPHYKAHCLINDFLAEVPDFTEPDQCKPAAFAAGRRMLEAPAEEQIAIIEAILQRRAWVEAHTLTAGDSGWTLRNLAHLLWRQDLPYNAPQVITLVTMVASQMGDNGQFDGDLIPILKICESLKSQNALSAELQQALRNLKAAMKPGSVWESAARKRARDTIDRLAAPEQLPLDLGEAWSGTAVQQLVQMLPETRGAWLSLLYHCLNSSSSKPTQKWSEAAQVLVEAIGRDAFKTRVTRWFELVALPRTVHREPRSNYEPDPNLLITDRNATILKGLTWACAGWQDTDIIRALSRLAEACFKKVPNLGARCPRVGNACLHSLSVTSGNEAAAELNRLNLLIKKPSTRKLIGKSLDKVAESSGQTREDLEEITVPTYGLDAESCLKQTLGGFTAEFRLIGPEAMELQWHKADGKLQKSIPVEVKENHATELKALKRTLQDLEKMLPAQRQRLERLLLSEREWDFDAWRERYLTHPLLAFLTRRLVWHFRQKEQHASGIWRDGKIVDFRDRSIDWPSSKTRVRLWHPLGEPGETVASWRQWLETHEVTQPFKQAHREIYILTDAERQTGTYSNRFAAHIIRQHQLAALAKERGWTYQLQGAFDSANSPTLLLPRWDLAAEFWVDSPHGIGGTSEAGIYLHVSTDQVRFSDTTGTPRPLEQVPALVFSEVMRDVDLFVGVCSIGNDPNWQDRGESEGLGGYWYRYSFGDLSVPAKTRREVLERLLPRLKISSQCSLNDRFLIVRGTLTTYKIHLGSSNILMEPNNRYLCIVPDRSQKSSTHPQVLLPFEGDNTLAVILSKAFMLADDSKIKDQSILNQIRVSR
jgi:hypothetical protein